VNLEARVTSKGQLTIPKEVRRALGVREGDRLVFELHGAGDAGEGSAGGEGGEEVRVRVARKPVSFADYEGAWREGEGMSLAEVEEYMRELRGYED
jgi:AbrB family looped-hinge helix DNA binding protein